MVLHLPASLESALTEKARQEGVAPEVLVEDLLRRHLLPASPPAPADDWERQLLATASDCGVSLSDAALSREAIYD